MNFTLKNHETFPMKGRRQLSIELWNTHSKIFSMLYDVPLHTARLESNTTKRVFMVYTEGKRLPKHVFKDEYGFDIGYIDPHDADENYGSIQVFPDTFYYNLNYISKGILHVYQAPGIAPLLAIKLDSYTTGINNLPDDYFNFLIAGVCWYVQLPVTKALTVSLENIDQPSSLTA